MDGEQENEGNEVKNDPERAVSADSSNEEGNYPTAVNEHEEEGETVASNHDEEKSESMKSTEEAPVEEAATSEPEENSGNELPCGDHITTSEDSDVKINETNERPMSHEESIVFAVNSSEDSRPSGLHVETPEREDTSPTREEVEGREEAAAAAAAAPGDVSYEEHAQRLEELRVFSGRLQVKLAEYVRKKAGDDARPERETPASEQLQEYERCVHFLSDLKRQLAADSEAAQQRAEELRSRSREKLDMVENEWRAFVALKQDLAVTALSPGKEAAQAKVESTLAAEQLRQDQLTELRLKHIKLRIKIRRLEAELREAEEHTGAPVKLRFEQLQAERLELKKHAEKQNEESLKIRKKIGSSLELLTNVKEKLFWSQMEVQAKREQLAEVEAEVAGKRDLLTRTKQARDGLQRDNRRFKECRGLLGNRVLLRDFEDAAEESDHLERRLENLKGRRAAIASSSGRWKERLETGIRQERKMSVRPYDV